VVSFVHGEGRGSVLAGVTVRGGTGTLLEGEHATVGGGVLGIGAAPTLRDCIIEENSAGGSGGGVHLRLAAPGTALIERCTIRDNDATVSLYGTNGGGMSVLLTGAEIVDCTITGNAAWDSGGGLTLSLAHVLLLRCTIDHNTVRHSGGGLEVEVGPATDVVVRDCLLRDNVAGVPLGQPMAGNAGAMVVEVGDTSGGSVLVVDTVMRDNFANQTPGLSYWTFGVTPATGPRLTVDHCTISGNVTDLSSSSGTALAVQTLFDAGENTGVVVRNSLLWGNTGSITTVSPRLVSPFLDALPDLQACDVQGGYPGAGNFSADPLFADAAADDLHLTALSPCVGAGVVTATAPAADFEGDPLPSGATPDIGADEFHAHLYSTGSTAAGGLLHVKLVAPPVASPTVLFIGAQLLDPPLVTNKGSLQVDPLFLLVLPALPASGLLDLPAVVPAGLPPGLSAFLQAFTGGALTNLATVTFD
jgi:hypothetical protein